jgi:hypothetical protein
MEATRIVATRIALREVTRTVAIVATVEIAPSAIVATAIKLL